MAGLEHGEDFFSDDDLDALPQNALDELEQNAILQTQHQTQATLILEDPQSSDYGDVLDDDDLDDAEVINKAQIILDRRQSLQSRNAGSPTQREQFRQNRYGGYGNVDYSSNRVPLQQLNPLKQLSHIRAFEQITDERVPSAQPVEVSKQAEVDINVEDLQKQVQELLHERESLQRDLSTKAGEISIVRSKQEKVTKEYERELTAVKKLNAERLAKQEKAIEIARDAEKNATTELEFLKRDLVEEAEKVRSLKKLKEKERESIGEPATPKKNKALPYRDGFDDDEIQIISPAKFHARKSNPGTPTKAGTKRKRKGQDSPIVPLQVEENDRTQDGQEPNPGGINELLLERIHKRDDRLGVSDKMFLETILDHRPSRDRLRTIEEFAKVAFPSTPKESFASIIFGKLPSLSKQSTADFPIEFCELLISLWKKCLTEKYYAPVSLLVDLLTFCIELKTLAVSPFLMETLLPVAQDTGELIAWPRFHRQPCGEIEKYIDVSACLAIIHLTALGCMNDKDHTRNFWRWMRLEFVLVVLSQNQPVEDFDMMLQLLAMSTMKDSVGPIVIDPELQSKQAEYIIDRVSYMLTNSPTVSEFSPKQGPVVISALRLQVLNTLYAFCKTPWGGEAIAIHQNAIGKLVKLLSDELDVLYDHHSGHKQSARIICLAIRLLHHLTTKHEKNINMQDKLSRIHGGNQKYLICLARLNFSEEDLVLDAEIDPEVAECAHEMLELAVTPEEGDAIHSAFSNS